MSILKQIPDGKQFERLCADLLECEGFIVESEPYVDRSGTDIRAVEEYRSHVPGRTIRVSWRVQCKHYAKSGDNLGRKEVEEAIYAFEATRSANDGLFLFVSTDYTEPAQEVVDKYVANHPTAKVTLWNGRQIIARLERHQHLHRRYGLSPIETEYLSCLMPLAHLTPCRVLYLSDQSALAHNLASALKRAGFELVFVPFWNYSDPMRLELLVGDVDDSAYGLIISFLGDSFGLPVPRQLTQVLLHSHRRGTPILLFPFLAWTLRRGLNPELQDVCPVRLIDPSQADRGQLDPRQIVGDFRRGDFRWLLDFDSFAEDQYVEYDPTDVQNAFGTGIQRRFGLSHSFEYLRPIDGATASWSDTSGNPLLVVSEHSTARIAYVNTCCHACMSRIAISSPLEASAEFGTLTKNVISWLLERCVA
jgi:hypothetical protein